MLDLFLGEVGKADRPCLAGLDGLLHRFPRVEEMRIAHGHEAGGFFYWEDVLATKNADGLISIP